MSNDDDYVEINTVLITKYIPEHLREGFNDLFNNWLVIHGYDPLDFEYEEDDE